MSDRGLDRRTVLRGMAAMSAMPAIATSAGAGAPEATTGPSGVHVAYGARPSSQLTVGWTGAPAPTATVEYWKAESGAPTDAAGADASPAPVPGLQTVAYTATLQPLEPDTEYAYRVVTDHGGAGPFTARTAPAPEGRGRFTVTAVGDHGVFDANNPAQRVQDDDPERVIDIAREADPAFHLCVGDIAYANGHPTTWEEYFTTFEDFYATTPFMTVPGNHEAEPGTGFTQYDRRLNELMPIETPALPNLEAKRRWYDFRYRDALFVGLNTSADACWDALRAEELVPIDDPSCQTEQLPVDVPPEQEATLEEQAEAHLSGKDQARYLERTLKEADDVTWTIVYFHGPMWTSSPDHPDRRDLRKLWGPALHDHGVDLVLSGDNHVWERTKPITGPDEWNEVGGTGTTFVTNGTGGTSHYAFEAAPEFVAARDNDHFGITSLEFVPTLAAAFGQDAPDEYREKQAIVVRYEGYPAETDLGNDSYPVSPPADHDIPAEASARTVDEFAIVKTDTGEPRQIDVGRSPPMDSPE